MLYNINNVQFEKINIKGHTIRVKDKLTANKLKEEFDSFITLVTLLDYKIDIHASDMFDTFGEPWIRFNFKNKNQHKQRRLTLYFTKSTRTLNKIVVEVIMLRHCIFSSELNNMYFKDKDFSSDIERMFNVLKKNI